MRVRLQRQLLVRHALEGQPVQRGDTEPLDGVPVLGRRVADVRGELPPGMHGVGAMHEAITRDLRDDRGRGDGRARGVAVDDRALLVAEVGHGEAVGEAERAGPGDADERLAQRREVRAMQAAPVSADIPPGRC